MRTPEALEESLSVWRVIAVRERKRQDRMLRDLATPSGLRRVRQDRIKAIDLLRISPYTGLGLQKRLLAQLVERPKLLNALGGLSDIPRVMVEQAEEYRRNLRREVSAELAAAESPAEERDVLRRLAAERGAILECLQRIGQVAVAGDYLAFQLPRVVLGLLIALIVIGDVAGEILQEREAQARCDD